MTEKLRNLTPGERKDAHQRAQSRIDHFGHDKVAGTAVEFAATIDALRWLVGEKQAALEGVAELLPPEPDPMPCCDDCEERDKATRRALALTEADYPGQSEMTGTTVGMPEVRA